MMVDPPTASCIFVNGRFKYNPDVEEARRKTTDSEKILTTTFICVLLGFAGVAYYFLNMVFV